MQWVPLIGKKLYKIDLYIWALYLNFISVAFLVKSNFTFRIPFH